MASAPTEPAAAEAAFAASLYDSVVTDLAMILDRPVTAEDVAAELADRRPAGEGAVHVSFRLGLRCGAARGFGAFLVPLPEALTLASFLMAVHPAEVEARRAWEEPDEPTKDALLELGNFVAGAVDAVVRTWWPEEATCRSLGCQGVRAGVRPAFPYAEGSPLLVARARMRLDAFPAFPAVAMLPPPPGA